MRAESIPGCKETPGRAGWADSSPKGVINSTKMHSCVFGYLESHIKSIHKILNFEGSPDLPQLFSPSLAQHPWLISAASNTPGSTNTPNPSQHSPDPSRGCGCTETGKTKREQTTPNLENHGRNPGEERGTSKATAAGLVPHQKTHSNKYNTKKPLKLIQKPQRGFL